MVTIRAASPPCALPFYYVKWTAMARLGAAAVVGVSLYLASVRFRIIRFVVIPAPNDTNFLPGR